MTTNTYLLLALVGWLSNSLVLGLQELNADNGLDRGSWGLIDQCDGGVTFALDFKYEKTGQLDNTCGNSIKLFCHTGDGQIGSYITSTEGNYGDWQGISNCPPSSNITGFRVRVLPKQGTWSDDQGVDNVQVRCSDGTVLDGLEGVLPTTQRNDGSRNEWDTDDSVHERLNIDGKEVEVTFARTLTGDSKIYGDWGSWVSCTSGAIAAIETRVEQGHPFDDDAGLCDVTMYCL